MMKGEGEGESFGFEGSISSKSTVVLGLVGVGKQLNLDRKLIGFAVVLM